MRSLTGWLVLVEENELNKVMDEGGIGSGILLPPASLKKDDEVFLASFTGNKVMVVGLYVVSSVSEEGLGLKPEIRLAEKMLELQASEIKGLEEPLRKGMFSLGPEDYDKLREGLERLGMEESMGAGLTIPG